MASLTEVSTKTKKFTVISFLVIIGSLFLKIVVSIIGYIAYVVSANAPLVAQNGFGQIPNIQVNALPYNHSAQVQFVLNTPNGGFPQEPSLADVYKFNQVGVSLLSVDNAQRVAREFGFSGSYQKLSDYIYDWKQGAKDFVFNVQTNQFRIVNRNIYSQISADITSASSQSNGQQSLTQTGSINAATNILQSLPVSSDYDVQHPSVVFLNYSSSGPEVVEQDISNANAVKVIYHRSYKYLLINQNKALSTQTLPLLSDNPLNGNITITVDSDYASLTSNVLEVNFSDWPIDGNTYSTYSLKSPQQAWQDVQNGNAYLVYLVKPTDSPYSAYQTLNVNKFEAEDISLAYFDGIKQQQYLEPVYVIRGTAILSDGTAAQFYFYDSAII